ncbi:hypothetical protein E1267_30260 [Nonomuraea longispora]|uniref:Secreted protein n=1 Tax=Nonomuraea longispora TaxID=1848320 RepID=A0A4R4N0D7_9ACTN|nr:hypothetical protein [Nonomuraea longispora]TDC02048.1 hypothetical protein E1267_30260 [Nonomuraea longispora]
MRPSPRQIAAVAMIAAATGMTLSAPAHAVIDPTKLNSLESITKIDPVVMANCVTGSTADPVGAAAVPPEVPLVGCLTL